MFVVLFLFKIVCLALNETYLFYFAVLCVVSSVAIFAPEKRDMVCFTFVVFRMSCLCYRSLTFLVVLWVNL